MYRLLKIDKLDFESYLGGPSFKLYVFWTKEDGVLPYYSKVTPTGNSSGVSGFNVSPSAHMVQTQWLDYHKNHHVITGQKAAKF